MNKILVEVSVGELLDKISILEIKKEKIKNPEKLKFVNEEHNLLKRYNKYNSAEYFVKPTENFCILFPSYLPHYVEPNLNKQNRISISFNYGF